MGNSNSNVKCEEQMTLTSADLHKINIEEPYYDQSTFWGRYQHFLSITNPMKMFVPESVFEEARDIVTKHRCRAELPACMTEKELWKAKYLYDAAYHPDSGEKMNRIGRMSAQMPMNCLITGAMMTWYQTTPAVVFWQWVNQSFNALVNFTNRSGEGALSGKQLLTAYFCATGGAVATAVALNAQAKKAPPVFARLVPFTAIVAANLINVPCMRAQELRHGTPIYDSNGNKVGNSTYAAQKGIGQCVIGRIFMAAPGMVIIPFVLDILEKRGTLCRYPWISLPVNMVGLSILLTFSTPFGCALFKQKAEIRFSELECSLQEKLVAKYGEKKVPYVVFFNKGL